ncbi:tryptophan-tRNA ligase [Acanthamoeba castellanii str. Neff]|uniref:tryptophan--tRNA ligase n=1 Tax=Acanthamoeba castellanii (strain ATCC 30010 / Neff) TaxID=1257118 RepID=L8GLY4_ACACF|nr:tryptophan-tRNA ligase [Acanthamoeba castellanii str. Neff]ELR14070.1 tryptophan-tRNA ligase [Acanthamoeba castellanii str. Neff]
MLRQSCGRRGSGLALAPYRGLPAEAGRIFSGIQPKGHLHLGNYLGAVVNWLQLQEQRKGDRDGVVFCVVNMHSYTTDVTPEDLRDSTREMAIALLACGIDPEKCILYAQSEEKKASQGAMFGLFAYPVLMAADILLYRASQIPVGDDQLQHLELAREIAGIVESVQAFNRRYNRTLFPLPQPILGQATRVMSLRDGTAKMSKSDPNDRSRINLTDSKDEILFKLQKAKTDPLPGIVYDPENRPELANLLSIFSALTNRSVESLCHEYADAKMPDFKNALAPHLVDTVGPIGERIRELRDKPQWVEDVLQQGASRARTIARRNLQEVKQVIGML